MSTRRGQVAVTKCDICAENIGTQFCYDCNNYLCQSCQLFHQKFPATRQHSVVNSQDVDKLFLNNKHVREHHKQDYSLFCSTCDSLICTLCTTSVHNSHNFKALPDVVDETRACVEGNILLLKDKKHCISALIEDIKLNKLKKMEENLDIYSQQVKETTKGLSQIVESVSRIDMTRVSDHHWLQRKQLEQVLSELERLSKDYSSLLEKNGQILSVEHDVTFILSQQTLAKELIEIDDIPNVDEFKLFETFSNEHFVESLIENIQDNYKLRGKKALESKVNELEAEITVLKANGKTWQAQLYAERKAEEKLLKEKEALLQDMDQCQIQNQQLLNEVEILSRKAFDKFKKTNIQHNMLPAYQSRNRAQNVGKNKQNDYSDEDVKQPQDISRKSQENERQVGQQEIDDYLFNHVCNDLAPTP